VRPVLEQIGDRLEAELAQPPGDRRADASQNVDAP
jgi:hypothetical protein